MLNEQGHPCPTPISEMRRRWGLLREEMDRRNLDCLIFYNPNRLSSGQIRYVSDVHLDRIPVGLLFLKDGSMIFLAGGRVFPDSCTIGEVQTEQIALKSIDTLAYTGTNMGRRAAGELKARQCRRLGAVGASRFPAGFLGPLRESFPGAIEECSDWFDRVRAIKSPYEIQCVFESARQHDSLAAQIQALLTPGITEAQLRNQLNHIAFDLGFSDTNINFGFDPKKPGFSPIFFQNRAMRPGDYVMGLIQGNGFGGYAMEVGRIWCTASPSPAMERAYEDALQIERFIAGQLKPGASPKKIFQEANAMLTGLGYAPEWRLFGHAEGFDYIERPSIMPEEDMEIMENMVFAVHPTASGPDACAFACDNYLVKADGAVRINQTPQTLLFASVCG